MKNEHVNALSITTVCHRHHDSAGPVKSGETVLHPGLYDAKAGMTETEI